MFLPISFFYTFPFPHNHLPHPYPTLPAACLDPHPFYTHTLPQHLAFAATPTVCFFQWEDAISQTDITRRHLLPWSVLPSLICVPAHSPSSVPAPLHTLPSCHALLHTGLRPYQHLGTFPGRWPAAAAAYRCRAGSTPHRCPHMARQPTPHPASSWRQARFGCAALRSPSPAPSGWRSPASPFPFTRLRACRGRSGCWDCRARGAADGEGTRIWVTLRTFSLPHAAKHLRTPYRRHAHTTYRIVRPWRSCLLGKPRGLHLFRQRTPPAQALSTSRRYTRYTAGRGRTSGGTTWRHRPQAGGPAFADGGLRE